MRILHTSDWHLGRVFHDHRLLPDQAKFLGDLLAHLGEVRYDALIIAGDIFDLNVPSEEAVATWNRFLEAFVETCPETTLVAIAGNHDSGTRVSVGSRLIEKARVHIRGGAERLEEPVPVVDAQGRIARVWLVPFLWSGSLVKDGEEGGLVLRTQEEALTEAIQRIRTRLDPAELNLLVAHCFASGGKVSDSERTLVGTAVQVDPWIFEGFDYVALGHLHRSQALSPRVCYSGSPIAYSFSEAGQAKSMTSVTLGEGVDPELVKVSITPLRPMKDLQGTMKELQEDPQYAGLEGTYVRVSLTEPAGVSQPVARLRLRFPLLLDFKDFTAPSGASSGSLPDLRKVDLLEEFKAFEQRLRGEDGASERLIATFTQLREEVEKSR